MDTLIQDLKYGLRQLVRNPGFTAVAVLTLALGIGANTAIFSVVNAVVLQPLPYPQPDRLVKIWNTWTGFGLSTVSPPEYLDYKQQTTVFKDVAAHSGTGSMNIAFGTGEPERVPRVYVTPNLFAVLGVEPLLGRTFRADEAGVGNFRVLILSYGLWQRRLGGDPGVIGKSFPVDGNSYTVVGVMPPEFEYPEKAVQIWHPFWFNFAERARGNRGLRVLARLKDGATLEAARAEMDTLARRFQQDYPSDYPEGSGWGVKVVSLHEEWVGGVRAALLILLAASGLLLLIGCANVANLLLARATARKREVAVRVALGAGRWRLIRQLLTESLLLALLGGLAGVVLAVWGVDSLGAVSGGRIPRLHEVEINVPVLGYALLLALLTGCLFGLAPAWQVSSTNVQDALKEAGRGTPAGRHRVRSLLVVSQVGSALVLLAGAGLLLLSFWRLQRVDPGFDPKNVLTAQVLLSDRRRYQDQKQIGLYFEELRERLEGLAEVDSASAISNPPFSGWNDDDAFEIEGRPPTTPGLYPDEELRNITRDYFRTLRLPLVRGRDFTSLDTAEAQPVAIISEALARKHWGERDPIGQRIRRVGREEWITIVGVVGDVRHLGLGAEIRPIWYLPVLQPPLGDVNMTVMIRSRREPTALAAALRQQVRTMNPDQPIYDVKTMEEAISASLGQPRFSSLLLGLFALLAVALAAVGIYGVISYAVAQRTGEIGIRMALGAVPRAIFWMVVREGLGMTLAGLLLGWGGVFVVTRWLESLLFGVSPLDPTVLIGVSGFLTSVALAACWVPARRATRVDPLVALRYE